jgi:hypothetical protein
MIQLRRTIAVIVALLWTASAFAQPTATVTHDGNLRPTPSTTRPPIRLLTPPEVVTLVTVSTVNGYYHVHTARGEDGWMYRSTLTLGSGVPPPTLLTCGPGTEVVAHPSCPAVGKHSQNGQLIAYPSNSDPGLRNLAKRHLPAPACTPKTFTLDDALSLQNFINNTYADAHTTKTTFAPTRNLHNIPTFDGVRGEGDLVQLSGYLTVTRDEGAESVNCAGNDGTDIHINIGPKTLSPSEYNGIIAEMIPQLPRPIGWDSTTLNRLTGKQVLLMGGLTYDNEHFVNDNPAAPKSGQPKRISLWEIHPITAFFVCPAGDGCDPANNSQWMALTDWAKAHP